MGSIPHEQLDSPNGAAVVDVAPRKRPRGVKGRFVGAPADAAPAGGDEAPVAEPVRVGGEDPASDDFARSTDRVADPPAGFGTLPLDPPTVAQHAGFPDVSAGLPDLRRKTPVPVVPWPLRLQRRLKEATRPGKVEAEHDARIEELLPRIAGRTHTIGVIGPKGGAGKSTVALTLSLVLAQYAAARPVLCELNPDWGTLDELLGQPTPRTLQDVLRDYTAIDRTGIGLLQGYLTMAGRLPVLTVPNDPEAMARLAPRDYDRVLRLLSIHYSILILDCGTAFTQRLNQYAIQNSDHLVVVGWPEQATMRKTLAAVDYLASSRYAQDYRGVLAETERAEVRTRALDDITLVVNGAGHAGAADPTDPAKVRRAAAGLNAVVELPFSPALRRLLADGTLTIEALPRPYRRAVKAVLVAVLERLAAAGAGVPMR